MKNILEWAAKLLRKLKTHISQVSILFFISLSVFFLPMAVLSPVSASDSESLLLNNNLEAPYKGQISLNAEEIISPQFLAVNIDSEGKLIKKLHAKNSDMKIQAGPLTKLMLAELTLDAINSGELKENEILYTEWSDLIGLTENGEAVMGLEFSEEVSVSDLLYGLIMNDANDAARILSREFNDTDKTFASRANEKAKELGMKTSVFYEASGLQNNKNSSSLEDLALLTASLMKKNMFREIINSKKHVTAASEIHGSGIELLSPVSEFSEELPSDETGYFCGFGYGSAYQMLSIKKYNGTYYLILSSGDDNNFAPISEHGYTLNYLFESPQKIQLLKKGDPLKTLPLKNGSEVNEVSFSVPSDLLADFAPVDDITRYKLNISLPSYLSAPLKKGDIAGVISVSDEINGGKKIYQENLLIENDIRANFLTTIRHTYLPYIMGAFGALFLLLMIYLTFMSFRNKKISANEGNSAFYDFTSEDDI